MTRRNYGQSCSVAGALDRIGERWSLLIVRELLLGPLRFSDLTRAVGDAPTDSVARRLHDFEADGIVERRQLGPPVSAVVYELTPLGRELEAPLLALGRWGLNFFRVEDIPGIESSWLPNSLRVILQPPRDVALTVQLHSEGQAFRLRVKDGGISAERGEATDPDLTLTGSPRGVIAALVGGEAREGEVEIEGDRATLQALRAMVVLPERLRAEALTEIAGQLTAA
jgi:DNA-binding HxlR family transcriptional regulator